MTVSAEILHPDYRRFFAAKSIERLGIFREILKKN
jgi:hypothetical protein